jgi:L-rhamnose-H+ transport protein
MANPLLGVVFHWIGGFASASFYVPYKGVKRWSWEVLWLTGGIVSWIVAPWLFASLETRDLLSVLSHTAGKTLFLCWLFGALWGFGGLTFGLTMRYLGISVGTTVALGLTAAFGTLTPPIVSGQIGRLVFSHSGQIVLLGVLIGLVGIVIVGLAGRAKEAEQATRHVEGQPKAVHFTRGVLVAVFSGVMSSCFAYGLAAGQPIRDATLKAGTWPLAQGLPVLCVVLAGGFTTNALWCAFLIWKNRSGGEFAGRDRVRGPDAGPAPLLRNYALCALGGAAWYFQFFFYTMGESQMGRYGFSSWTLHMVSIILFATVWGLALKEWKGASRKSLTLLSLGLAVLIGSTVVIGFGNALAEQAAH